MRLYDKNYLGNVYERIDKSVKRANELLVNYQKDKASVEQLQAVLAQEQLAMQHEILITLAMIIWEPKNGEENLPKPPEKMIGFK
jgi:hypothetical protein